MWEFSVGLYTISVWPDSLLFAAIYGVVESASTFLFGPTVGKLVDKFTYLQVLCFYLSTQSLSFVVAGSRLTTLLVHQYLKSTHFMSFYVLVVLTNASGAIGVLPLLLGGRDFKWPTTRSADTDEFIHWRIDLSCKLLAPVFSGFIIRFISLEASAIILALWNIMSVWLQYWLLVSAYNRIHALSESSDRGNARLVSCAPLESQSVIEEYERLSDREGK
ncbi:Solute carrier family 40 member 2 [Acorus gramineus]|uniref:Solute carrier family 40 member n=1 Tax=Acorus gramineus TaxID=55184 RepID=A0AAV9AV66_ACOGR|nr:Solute carrier family 40 member 2 [Acorus gramineus]